MIEGIENPLGTVEYPLQISKFMSCASLTIGIESNHGADFTEIKYIGLKGENTGNRA